MSTAERLRDYHVFDDAVIAAVDQAADYQNNKTYNELATEYNVENSREVVPPRGNGTAIELVTLRPYDYERQSTRVLHLPMAIPVDASAMMRAMRLFAADPTKQLVVVGNPAAAGTPRNRLTWKQIPEVYEGKLDATVDPLLYHLSRNGITHADHIGYSYGADKAAVASKRSAAFGIEVKHGVFMESAAGVNRSLPKLLKAFAASGGPLESYVAAAASAPLQEARALADTGLTRYVLGLLRASNIAIAHSLTTGSFECRVDSAMRAQPSMKSAIVWGTKSELAPDEIMTRIVANLRQQFVYHRIQALIMHGMHHAGGDDIDLHAAMVLQSFAKLSS